MPNKQANKKDAQKKKKEKEANKKDGSNMRVIKRVKPRKNKFSSGKPKIK